MKACHDSRFVEYRSKPGALQTGERVMLYIWTQNVTKCSIIIQEGLETKSFEMQQIGNMWQYEYTTPQIPCIVWYKFLLTEIASPSYYGPPTGRTQGEGLFGDENSNSFQITVFEHDFKTPDWAKNAVMYQIFPDRFSKGDPQNLEKGINYHRSMARKVAMHDSFDCEPIYQPILGETRYSPCDYYGGDLIGIEKELPYIKSLGISVIYLNPINEAVGYTRYNISNYMKVDPVLGSNYDFSHLCKVAKEEYGIRIILDGVYSHVSSDSVYFNEPGHYDSLGAHQSKMSPYYDWFSFYGENYSYKLWWGFNSLPQVNISDISWQKYIIFGKNSVMNTWLNMGASGFRLDVADEIPDDIIEMMRRTIKNNNPDNLLIGEVWEDATTKYIFGVNRRYTFGKELDSVMNYPFRASVIDFFNKNTNAFTLIDFLIEQKLNYPKEFYYVLMNLLSSHDVPRLITLLGSKTTSVSARREEQSTFTLSDKERKHGEKMVKLATVLQFIIPGIPSIYYGDEQGMCGFDEPFNRRPFKKLDPDLEKFFSQIAKIRNSSPLFATGGVLFYPYNEDVFFVVRGTVDGCDKFGKKLDCEEIGIITFINRSKSPCMIDINIQELPYTTIYRGKLSWKSTEVSSIKNLITNEHIDFDGTTLKCEVGAEDFIMFSLF